MPFIPRPKSGNGSDKLLEWLKPILIWKTQFDSYKDKGGVRTQICHVTMWPWPRFEFFGTIMRISVTTINTPSSNSIEKNCEQMDGRMDGKTNNQRMSYRYQYVSLTAFWGSSSPMPRMRCGRVGWTAIWSGLNSKHDWLVDFPKSRVKNRARCTVSGKTYCKKMKEWVDERMEGRMRRRRERKNKAANERNASSHIFPRENDRKKSFVLHWFNCRAYISISIIIPFCLE